MYSGLAFNRVFQEGSSTNLPFVSLYIGNRPVRMMVDTGCSVNIIDELTYSIMCSYALTTTATSFGYLASFEIE